MHSAARALGPSAGDFWVSGTGGAFEPQVVDNGHDVDFLVVWESNGSIHGQRVWGAGGGSDLWGSQFTVAQQTTGGGYDIWYGQPDVATTGIRTVSWPCSRARTRVRTRPLVTSTPGW